MEERRASNTTTILYNRILEYEQRMDSLRFDLSASVRAGDHNRTLWFECRHYLRQLHEELLLQDMGFVERGALLCALWNRLYYGPVEQMRLALGKAEEHEVVRSEVLSIIDEGMGYFMILAYRLRQTQQACPPPWCAPQAAAAKGAAGQADGCDASLASGLVYECLVYLGDLARYKCSFDFNSFALAEGHYLQATHLLSTHGHAFNQLAVLYCLRDEVLPGLFYYLRATMSIRAFPKSADNLLTLSRRLVNVNEDRLALSEDPARAALFGLLLRLVAVVIVHELARNSQFSLLEGITAALAVLLQSSPASCLLETATSADEETLALLCSALILGAEFLQKSPASMREVDFAGQRYLCSGQMQILEWLFVCCGQLLRLRGKGMRSVSLVCLWVSRSDIVSRISNTQTDPCTNGSFHEAFKNFLRLFAQCANGIDVFDNLHAFRDDQLLVGSRPLGRPASDAPGPATFRARVRELAESLCREHCLFVLNPENPSATYMLREDAERMTQRERMMTLMAQQRLAASNHPPADLPDAGPAHWHLCDAEVLLQHWSRLEGLLKVGAIRLIITLATLRYLDFAKSDPQQQLKARHIMRCIATYNRTKGSHLHLQHPKETATALPTELAELTRHHKALLSAYLYYSETASKSFAPVAILTEDERLVSTLDRLGDTKCVTDIATYLSRL